MTTVEDNAGGIKVILLKNIWTFLHIKKNGGSGIGLFMSKLIIRKKYKW